MLDLHLGNMAALPLLIRDPAYQLLPWIMGPYTSQLDLCKAYFNKGLGWTCGLLQCAFGSLKGCWCTLHDLEIGGEANIPWVIIVAYGLHNICEAWGGSCEAWMEEAKWAEDSWYQECQLWQQQ